MPEPKTHRSTVVPARMVIAFGLALGLVLTACGSDTGGRASDNNERVAVETAAGAYIVESTSDEDYAEPPPT